VGLTLRTQRACAAGLGSFKTFSFDVVHRGLRKVFETFLGSEVGFQSQNVSLEKQSFFKNNLKEVTSLTRVNSLKVTHSN
jgi:hypothetical protein